MSDTVMVVAVVAIGCVTAVLMKLFSLKSNTADENQSRRIDALEARIRALEDAVSDPERNLREQFRELESG